MAIVGVASIRVRPDLTEFRKELNAELKSIKATLDVAVHADTKLAAAEIAAFVKKESGKVISQRVEVDTSGYEKVAKKLGDLAAATRGFNLASVAFTVVQTALQAIVPLIIASLGALLLVPGAVAAMGLAFVTAKLGADGIKKAFEGLKPTMDNLKAQVSGVFQSALIPAVNKLKTLIPQLTPGFKSLALAMSAVAVQFTTMLNQTANATLLKGLLDSTRVIILNVGSALTPIAQAFLTIAGVAAGALKDLTSGFSGAALQFSKFITSSANSGQLLSWIHGGLDALRTLGQIAVQAGAIVGAVFNGLSKGAGDLGGALLPVLKSINTALSGGQGAAALQALGRAFSQVGQAIGAELLTVLKATLPLITGVLTFIGDHAALVVSVATAVFVMAKAFGIAAAAMKAWTVIAGIFNITMSAGPIGIVVLAIGALIAAAILIITHWKPISAFFIMIGQAIASAFHTAIDWVVGVYNNVADAIKGAFFAVLNFFIAWRNTVVNMLNSAAAGVTGAFKAAGNAIVSAFSAVGSFFATIGNAIATAFQAAVSFIAGLPAKIVSFISALPQMLLDGFVFVVKAVVQGLEWVIAEFIAFPFQVIQIVSKLIGMLVSWAQTTGANVIAATVVWLGQVVAFFIALPGRILAAILNFATMLGTWFLGVAVSFYTTVSTFIQQVVAFFVALPGQILTAVVNFGSMLLTWITNVAVTITTAVSTFMQQVLSFFVALPGRIISGISNFGGMVFNWMASAIGNLVGALPGFISNVLSFFRSLPGNILNALGNAGSWLVGVGGDIIRGLWAGIQSAASWLWDKVTGFVGGIVDKFKGLLSIFSPSKVFRDEVGKYIAQGVGVGIESNAPFVYKKIDALAAGMTDRMSGVSVGANVAGQFNSAITASGALSFTPSPVVVNVAANAEGIRDFINVQVDSNNRQIVRGSKAGIGGTVT